MTVLVVDDSILMRNILKASLAEAGAVVVGEGGNGAAAVELNRELHPDLIIMDVNMPQMSGLEATKLIMAESPTAIVVFSNEADARISFKAIEAGAAEFVAKPNIDQFNDRCYIAGLMATFAAAVRATAIYGPGGGHARRDFAEGLAFGRDRGLDGSPAYRRSAAFGRGVEAVVIGASTGGPVAVRDLLRGLPADFPAGIALVQHIEARFDRGYADWLDGECALKVRLASQSDAFVPGEVIVAPSGYHLVCADRCLSLSDSPPVGNQKPSVDKLFETAALSFKERLAAVLLTGMGSDGAEGCVKVRAAGGLTLVQDEASSFIYGMPKAAVERGGAVRVLSLSLMPGALLEAVGYHG